MPPIPLIVPPSTVGVPPLSVKLEIIRLDCISGLFKLICELQERLELPSQKESLAMKGV